MANLGNFDATQIDPNTSYDPVPAGEYVVVILNSEVKETKSGNGRYLSLELEIVEGEFQGRKLWDNLNLWHSNATARDIAQRTLSAICHAVGVLQPQDSAELHGKPMVAVVRVKDDPQYGKRNEIKSYKAVPPMQAAPQQPPAGWNAPAAQQPAGTPPWAAQQGA